VLVTAHLLLEGQTGQLPIWKVIPEGFEDVDCSLKPGLWAERELFVQAKESTEAIGLAGIGDFLEHARVADPDGRRRLALITNAERGKDVRFSGWSSNLAEVLDASSVEKIAGRLRVGLEQSRALLQRSHLVDVAYSTMGLIGRRISQAFRVDPVIGELVAGILFTDLAQVAADQRLAGPRSPLERTAASLASLVDRIRLITDVGSLEEAVREGIVEVLAFDRASSLSEGDYLRGIDAKPDHIAAGLDLERREDMEEIWDALLRDRLVLIAGPSGSGKSTLLWRVAYSSLPRMRALRLNALRPEQGPALLRFIELQAPGPSNPLLLVADNVGRPQMSGWQEAMERLLERPGIYVVGAVREEDFEAALALRRATVHPLRLTPELAHKIADSLQKLALPTSLVVEEALPKSNGLLMEFLSLMLTGRRLEQVVGEQADALLRDPARVLERDAAHYVCAADVLGLRIPAESLAQLVGDAQHLPHALARLRDEHLVVQDGGEWSGLHELRSEVILSRLQAVPPPTEAQVFVRLLGALPPDRRAVAVPRVAIRVSPEQLETLVDAVSDFLSVTSSAKEAAALIDALAEIDALVHTRGCVVVARRYLAAGIDVQALLTILLPWRFAGVDMSSLLSHLRPARDELPDLPNFRRRALAKMTISKFVDLARQADAESLSIFLRSTAGAVAFNQEQTANLIQQTTISDVFDKASIASAIEYSVVDRQPLLDWLGPIDERLRGWAKADSRLLGWRAGHEPDGYVASVEILQPWTGEADAHKQSLEVAGVLAGLCVEADIVEVRTIGLDGKPLAVGEYEPGHQRLVRWIVAPRPITAHLQRVGRWTQRLEQANSWTNRLRKQRAAFAFLEQLLVELPRRVLDVGDFPRKREVWKGRITEFQAAVAQLPAAPVAITSEGGVGELAAPGPQQNDPVRQSLGTAGQALMQVYQAVVGQARNLGGASAQLRDALAKLNQPTVLAMPKWSDIGEPVPESSRQILSEMADLLFLLHEGRPIPDRPVGKSWQEHARDLLAVERRTELERERQALEDALGDVQSAWTFRRLPPSYREGRIPAGGLTTDRWVLTTTVEHWDGGQFWTLLPAAARSQLAFRTLVVVERAGVLLPVGALEMGVDNVFPLSIERLRHLATELEVELGETAAFKTVQSALNEAVIVSSLVTAGRLRAARGLPADVGMEALSARLDQAEASVRADVPGSAPAFQAFADLVRKEMNDSERTTLAAIFVGGVAPALTSPVFISVAQLAWQAALIEP
jgi:hypothetical protein